MSEPEFNGESEGEPEGGGCLSAPEDVLRLDDVEWTEFEADALVEVAKLSQRLIGQVPRTAWPTITAPTDRKYRPRAPRIAEPEPEPPEPDMEPPEPPDPGPPPF